MNAERNKLQNHFRIEIEKLNVQLQEKNEEVARLSRLEKQNRDQLRLEVEMALREECEEEKDAFIS